MPIVDGLTSTKMIRSFEKTHPPNSLSLRATLNHRIPVVAVSATLIESARQTYIDAGFDAWILKPVDFKRMGVLLNGIVDHAAREECLYKPGEWERGGWFAMAADSRNTPAVDTAPRPDAPVGGGPPIGGASTFRTATPTGSP